MVMEFICIAMVKYMKEASIMVKWKVKEYITMKIVLLTIMEVGTRDKNMGKEHILVKKKYIKENGSKEKDMEEGITKTSWPIKLIKVNLLEERDKVEES